MTLDTNPSPSLQVSEIQATGCELFVIHDIMMESQKSDNIIVGPYF